MTEAPTSERVLSAELVPFVPRLTLEWLRDEPEATWRDVEGTVAFIDISGFTAMSERLSSLGKAGAEEVTEVMNATFAALLAVAYAQGGGLLKFGGDALLLLYEGDDHARRAARAAFEMRRTLRAIGRPRTSAGAVQLRMHAGLHSGRFQFFLVGDLPSRAARDGPRGDADGRDGGHVGGRRDPRERRDRERPRRRHTLGEEKGEGRSSRAAPDARGTVAAAPERRGHPARARGPGAASRAASRDRARSRASTDTPRSGSSASRERTRSSRRRGRRRPRTRSTRSSEPSRRRRTSTSVTFLESDIDRDGGRIVLVSGAPQTFGDDEERMLRTVRAVVDAGLPLPVHIGVSEGRVFTGQVGASFRRTYTVLGDTAALAARLMARAGEDEIWVSAGAFARGGGSSRRPSSSPCCSRARPSPCRRSCSAISCGGRAARPEPREAAVRRSRARAGGPRRVGRPRAHGLRHARRARRRARNREVAPRARSCARTAPTCGRSTLRCEQYEASTPYYPFRPFLRSLLDVELNGGGEHNRAVLSERLTVDRRGARPWAPLLAAPFDVEVATTPEVDDLDPSFWRARLHGVMGTLLGHLLDSPTLLVFDDVHWMDDASSELLRYLGTQLSSTRGSRARHGVPARTASPRRRARRRFRR